MEYGYARVSTKEQNELRQLIALREFGLTDRAIFVDKQSGKDFDRRSYQRLLRKLLRLPLRIKLKRTNNKGETLCQQALRP